ncbi:hypothetical protein U1872_06335 [Sphingomonas sp. RB3P16]|uniref:hypothetical protein n=1 Tax=Parasphingomonas frigoris TaxID=3096163 RepID=UPI002FCA51F1
MSDSIEHHIRQLAPQGVRMHLWPVAGGGFQANVSERAGGWTCETQDDPIYALQEALRLRATGVAIRTVVHDSELEPRQIDIEDAIALAHETDAGAGRYPPPPADDDDFKGLMG